MSRKKIIKMLSMFTVVILSVSIAGCGGKGTDAGTGAGTGAGTSASVSSVNPKSTEVYPLKTNVTLDYWIQNNADDILTSYSEAEWAKEAERKTGVKINWRHSNSDAALDLVIASGDIPDIMAINWVKYKGGPDKALSEGNIIPLNDVFDKYAPNIKAFLKKYPDIDKSVKSDSGKYYIFPCIRSMPRDGAADSSVIYTGPIVRKDWLDDLGLQMPQTTDDWYNTLRAFKDKKGATAPFTVEKKGTMLIGSFGVQNGMYMANNKVKYGPIEPAFKEYLMVHNKWYQEGLIDKDYGTLDSKILAAKMTDGRSGASYANMAGGLQKWMDSMKFPEFQKASTTWLKGSKVC
jgi:putative aldouronate transport system substrate-binding protein